MSYYEYNISGELTPLLEEQTKKLLSFIDEGVPFSIVKYIDEPKGDEKINREFVLTSQINMWNFFFIHFTDSKMEYKVYYKQRIM